MQQLRAAHLTVKEIAGLCRADNQLIGILAGGWAPRPGQKRMSAAMLDRLMACDPADIALQDRNTVDATGTARRLNLMSARNFSLTYIGERLGWNQSSVTRWRTAATVPGFVASLMKQFYESVPRDAVGPSLPPIASQLRRTPILPDRYWTDEQLDDRGYDPLKPVNQPVGVRRRLRALYREGKGPVFLGAMLRESPETVVSWTVDGPVPGYARHLVSAVYERWAGPARGVERIPFDQAAVDLAVREGWPSSLAWEGVDIDSPSRGSHVASRERRGSTDVDLDLVRRALAESGAVGRREMTVAEARIVVTELAGRGLSAREIGVHLRWWASPDLSDRERSRSARHSAAKFCERFGIATKGSASKAAHENRQVVAA